MRAVCPDPSITLELYLMHRSRNLSGPTITFHQSRFSIFIDWFDKKGIDNLNDPTGRMFEKYQRLRMEETSWAMVPEKTQLETVRVLVR